MAQIMEAPFSLIWLERTIENRKMFRFEPALEDTLTLRHGYIFDRVMFIDMRQNLLGLLRRITQFFQGGPYSLVDNFAHASSGKKLVFYQRNVRLNARRVTIHQEPNRSRRCEDGHLPIPESIRCARTNGAIPNLLRFFLEEAKLDRVLDPVAILPMQSNDFLHRVHIIWCHRPCEPGCLRISISGKWSHR